jgi:pimeloyl-ACP methyl ester carboxylesterase
MLVWLHGDLTQGGPAKYHVALAEKAAATFSKEDVLSIALVRPGFPDGDGYYSSGNSYRRVDTYSVDNISEIGSAIERLKLRYKPGKVIIVGDSGGSAIAAVLLGMKPGIADGAVLVSCPCDLIRWRSGSVPWTRSEDPAIWAGKTSPGARIIAITGSEDTNTFPGLAESYVDKLRGRGVDASFEVVQGASHGKAMESTAVTEAISRLISLDQGGDIH